MSKNAIEIVKKELNKLEGVKLKEVSKAQTKMVDIFNNIEK